MEYLDNVVAANIYKQNIVHNPMTYVLGNYVDLAMTLKLRAHNKPNRM